jgi:hypothetical protein
MDDLTPWVCIQAAKEFLLRLPYTHTPPHYNQNLIMRKMRFLSLKALCRLHALVMLRDVRQRGSLSH